MSDTTVLSGGNVSSGVANDGYTTSATVTSGGIEYVQPDPGNIEARKTVLMRVENLLKTAEADILADTDKLMDFVKAEISKL
jgi:hypothetical protein